MKLLITDFAWPDLSIEQQLLEEAALDFVVSDSQDEEPLAALARDVHGIMTCWAPVTRHVIESSPICKVVSRMGIGLDNIETAQLLSVKSTSQIGSSASAFNASPIHMEKVLSMVNRAGKSGFRDKIVEKFNPKDGTTFSLTLGAVSLELIPRDRDATTVARGIADIFGEKTLKDAATALDVELQAPARGRGRDYSKEPNTLMKDLPTGAPRWLRDLRSQYREKLVAEKGWGAEKLNVKLTKHTGSVRFLAIPDSNGELQFIPEDKKYSEGTIDSAAKARTHFPEAEYKYVPTAVTIDDLSGPGGTDDPTGFVMQSDKTRRIAIRDRLKGILQNLNNDELEDVLRHIDQKYGLDEIRCYAKSQMRLMEARQYAGSQLSILKEQLIVEELTGADRSEIKRMIKKEIEGTTNKREIEKAFQKKFDVELKKALGTSFLGTPGKINKFVVDQIYDEVNKWLADTATRNEIAEITKQVLTKLYRELSFSSPTIIKRIKV